MAALYLSELLKPYIPSRPLRSTDQLLLDIPRSRLKNRGDLAFSVAAPKLWNSLPYQVRAAQTSDHIKTRLKTYLFALAFGTV